jgi:PhzF family phenazine biosynthesis protein
MLTIVQVDAFTAEPFAGNPAAVCLLPKAADEAFMQDVAREMNLSETAFLHRQGDGFRLRWFTPASEVALCGHATLASAHVLWEDGHLRPHEEARFHTQSGILTAVRRGEWIEMDFPSDPAETRDAPDDLTRALGLPPSYVGRSRSNYLVEVDSEESVRRLTPDLAALRRMPVQGMIVTSRSGSPEYDFVSRYFAPRVGIDEDPVTGSAHCTLGPYWSQRLAKNDLVGYQASARGGVVGVRVAAERVFLSGQAVTVMRGQLVV